MNTHTNLVDMIDCKIRGTKARGFRTQAELAEYTKATGKYILRDRAKVGGLLEYLLRPLINS